MIRRVFTRREPRSAPARSSSSMPTAPTIGSKRSRSPRRFAEDDVRWFEEPVSSDDLSGLRLLRDRAPGDMDVAAGEYGYDPFYFPPNARRRRR